MDDEIKVQLEKARELRLHQDHLRFAIPAAYFVYVGTALAAVARTDVNRAPVYGISALVGFGIFMIAIAEHYFYISFRNWERLIESIIFAPESTQRQELSGGAVSPCHALRTTLGGSKPPSDREEISKKAYAEILNFDVAREKFADISRPNLAQLTMAIMLFWIAMSSSLFAVLFLSNIGVRFPLSVQLIITLIMIVGQMLIYKFWHSVYNGILKRFMELFETR